jgi:hypothetical protein
MAKDAGITPEYGHSQPVPFVPERVPIWQFTRSLSCTLVYERRDVVIEVETDRGRHLSKRFRHEAQAVAYAESLRAQLNPEKWTAVAVPARNLRGQR